MRHDCRRRRKSTGSTELVVRNVFVECYNAFGLRGSKCASRALGVKLMRNSSLHTLGMLFIVLVFGACSATTPIVSEWRNPAYTSGSFKRIMVGGLGEDTSVRRNFEDEFVAQLRPAGIDALASYQFS